MANPKALSIVLSNPRCIYTPGQMVEGYVNLELREETKIKGIKLRYYGAAEVGWSEGGRRGTWYTNAESYFDESKYILGKEQTGEETIDQKPGSYKYPFNFQLPPGCPSTFDSEKGSVSYYVKAIMKRPRKSNIKSEVEFTVSAELDLNTLPHALSAVHVNDSKGSCCCCCATGPARVILNLQKKGYVPGEVILVNAEVTNEGRKPFKAVEADLVMRVKYLGKYCCCSKYGIDEEVMNALEHGELTRGQTDYFNGEMLTVPPMPASGLNGCSIIDIEHFVRINARVSGVGSTIHVPAEIIIGTSPSPQTEATSSGMPAPVFSPPSVNNYLSDQTGSGNKDLSGYKNTYSDFSQF